MKLLAAALACIIAVLPGVGLATEGTYYVAPSSGGTSGAYPYDWALPYYAGAGDELSGITLANWADAGGAFGGATTVCVAAATEGGGLVMNSHLASDCSTSHGSTNRAVGVLHAVDAGDFVRLFRVRAIASADVPSTASAISLGVVFVDGTTAAAAWYGAHTYSSAALESLPMYEYHHTAGAGAWDATSFTSLGFSVPYADLQDWALVRSGTSLRAYIGNRGGWVPVYTWTVTAGAGKVGVDVRTFGGVADYFTVHLDAFRASLTGLP